MTISYNELQDAIARSDLRLSRYLTTEEVAELCRAKAETVRYWRARSTGPKSFKVGRRVLYAREDVEAWLAAARNGAA